MSSLNLYRSDRECLIKGQWLTDSVVSASLELLKAEHPAMGGLQPTILGVKNDFAIQRGEFVQVSHCHVPLDYPHYSVILDSAFRWKSLAYSVIYWMCCW